MRLRRAWGLRPRLLLTLLLRRSEHLRRFLRILDDHTERVRRAVFTAA